jgi:RNA polymerase-interacting CarD/CdnL/TRCF family regulator
MFFDIGQIVVHKDHGLCKIDSKEFLSFAKKDYYVMYPLSAPTMKVMVPEDNAEIVCRNLLTKEQCLNVIDKMKTLRTDYIVDNKKRKEVYSKLLQSSNLEDIAQLINHLYFLFKDKKAANKAIGTIDTAIYNDAKQKLYSELGYVLELDSFEAVDNFIGKRLGDK